MTKYVILIISFFFSLSLNAVDNPPNKVKEIGSLLEDHIEYNKENNNSGNFFIYYSPDQQSTPNTIMTTEDWLVEDPVGIMPLASSLRDSLSKYNNLIYAPPSTKVQHYVIVVDVPIWDRVKVDDFRVKVTETPLYKGVNKRGDFKDLVKVELRERIKTFKVSEIFDDGSKIMISLAFINRVLIDNNVRAEVDFHMLRRKVNPDPDVLEYIQLAHSEFNRTKPIGLNIVRKSVGYFIEHFFKVKQPDVLCDDMIGYVTSTIAGDFILERCTDEMDAYPFKKNALKKSAQFIDALAYLKTLGQIDGGFANKWIGPDDSLSDWIAWVDLMLIPYLELDSPIYEYGPWLRDNYSTYYDGPLHNIHKRIYLEYFFRLDQPEIQSLIEMVEAQLDFAQIYAYLDNWPIGIFERTAYNESFKETFKWLKNGAYNNAEKNLFNNAFLNYTNLETVLWNFVFEPSLFTDVTETAGYVAEFILDRNPVIPSIDPPLSISNYVPIQYKDSYVKAKTHTLYNHLGTDIFIGMDGVGYYNSSTVSLTGSLISFELKLCDFRYDTPFLPQTLAEIGDRLLNDCSPVTNYTYSPPSSFSFFEPIYAGVLSCPGYLSDCKQSDGTPCSNITGLEPAFFVATKIRDKNYSTWINDVSTTVAIATLPFTALEYGAATGFWKVAHGVWLGSEITQIATTTYDDAFKDAFKYSLGEEAGLELYDDLKLINNLVTMTSLAGVFGTPVKLTDDQLIKAMAAQRYSDEVYSSTGHPIGESNPTTGKLHAEEISGIGAEIKNDLGQYSSMSNSEIEEGVRSVLGKDLLGINKGANDAIPFILKPENKSLKDLILRARDGVQDATDINAIHKVLNIMELENPGILDNLVTDLNNHPLFAEFLVETVDGVRSAEVIYQRLIAYQLLYLRNLAEGLKLNTKFLHRISQNPNLINFVDNLTAAGRLDLENNIDIWVKRYDARELLKTGNISEAVEILDGTLGNPIIYNGANYVQELIPPIDADPQDLLDIINSTTDVADISNTSGINQGIILRVKEHLFIDEHLVEIPGNEFVKGRFATYQHVADWWVEIANGNTQSLDEFKKLIAHEYIEGELMKDGLIYHVLENASASKYGAHNLSIHDGTGKFDHWADMGRHIPNFTLNPDFNNIDIIVTQIKTLEGI